MTPKQIIEWEMKHKNYREALNEEKSSNLLKLAKLYEAEFPSPIRKKTIKEIDEIIEILGEEK